MLITTLLTYFVVRYTWQLGAGRSRSAATGFFVAIDLTFFSANLLKVVEGGWFPLLIGALVFIAACRPGQPGRVLLHEHLRADAIELAPFLQAVIADGPMRAPGTAVFIERDPRPDADRAAAQPQAQQRAARARTCS